MGRWAGVVDVDVVAVRFEAMEVEEAVTFQWVSEEQPLEAEEVGSAQVGNWNPYWSCYTGYTGNWSR